MSTTLKILIAVALLGLLAEIAILCVVCCDGCAVSTPAAVAPCSTSSDAGCVLIDVSGFDAGASTNQGF